VELLTVIAIIGVLATLISASLSNAQRKGRKAVSTSNLRQIAIALNLYVDDREKRPDTYREITEAKYLSERVLLCPEDRIVKNWAGELEATDSGKKRQQTDAPGRGEATTGNEPNIGSPKVDVPHSYFKSFDYYDEIWQRIDKSAMGGLAACQLHGIGRQQKDMPPRINAYQGLVLRALKDGSVISRQVFWSNDDFGSAIDNPDEKPSSAFPGSGTSQLPLFIDPSE
jgi:type II secretory pathway pseudopilin PulG